MIDRRSFMAQGSALALLSTCKSTLAVSSLVVAPNSSTPPTISTSGNSWVLKNRLIAKRLWWNGGKLTGQCDQPDTPVASQVAIASEIYVIVSGRDWADDFGTLRLTSATHEASADTAWLELTFMAERSPLEITKRYVCRAGDPAIEEVCKVRNSGNTPVEGIERFDSCVLSCHVEGSHTAVSAHWVEGLHDDEKYSKESYRTYRVSSQTLSNGDAIDFDSGRWSSNEKLPAVVMQVGGRSYFAAFGWSGEWKLNAGNDGAIVSIQVGLSDTHITLPPGETIESPASFYGVVEGVSEDAWNAIHKHCRIAIMPQVADDFPWVTYNTWYNFGIKLQDRALREEVVRAAKLGVEVFYIDDGWFEGSKATGKWGMGAGNWVENREKFPEGISAFADHVHGFGMKFGLWVEPERVDASFLDRSGLPAKAWLATTQDQPIRWGFTKGDNETPAYQVCFGDSRSREWAINSLSIAIRDYKVDWLKWDHNRYEVCQDSRHGHGSDAGDWAHTHGVWEVMAELRRRFPRLIIENCAAGGHRFDFGMMRHTQVTWTSDQTSPAYISRRHVYGASHLFPPQYLTSWYISHSNDHEATLSPACVDTLFRSHMLGAFGISAKLANWPENVTASAMRSISLYKRIRRYLRGQLAWLTPQPSVYSPRIEEAKMWEATQMCLSETGESLIVVFRAASDDDVMTLRPRFIQKGKFYEIWDEDGRVKKQRYTAAKLTQSGFVVHLTEKRSSAILYVRQL